MIEDANGLDEEEQQAVIRQAVQLMMSPTCEVPEDEDEEDEGVIGEEDDNATVEVLAEEGEEEDEEDEDLDGKIVIADAWTVDGRHIPSVLTNEGHLVASPMYESEFAKDILSAAADVEKKEAYKKLEEALKESEAAKAADRKAQKEAQMAEEEVQDVEPIGFGGWIGLIVLALLVVGALTNFGQADKKKVNLNRKKGLFEKLVAKVKGQ